jgi:outer membrane protein assembly factor BamB
MFQGFLAVLGLWLAAAGGESEEFRRQRDDNWHQWRGPLANGVAPHGDPPVAWSSQTNIRWRAEIPGGGTATPIVWADQVFVLTAVRTDRTLDPAPEFPPPPPGSPQTVPPIHYYRFLVICLDRATGRVRWQQVAAEVVPHEGHHRDHGYASASPSTDGRNLYVSFGSRGIYCYDLQGHLRWSRDLGKMHTRYGYGEGTSPVLHGGRLVVNWDQEDESFLFTLDAQTGETVWQVPRDEVTSWATPLVVDHQGVTQVITNATQRVRGYDLADGKLLWQCGGQTVNVIPSPVALDGVVFCMSGYRGSTACALPLSARGDLTGSDRILWRYDRDTPYVPSPLLYGKRIYFTKSNNAVLSCLDAGTGEPLLKAERLPNLSNIYASPVGAADRIYLVGRDGTALVIKNQPRLEVLATNRLDEPIDASPAVVGRQLFLRGKSRLYCIEAN